MQSQPRKPFLTRFTSGRGKRFLKVVLLLVILAVGVLGYWLVLRLTLNTDSPLVPVSSGNMCLAQPRCDGFTHPFGRTLHIGDLVVVQGINARDVVVEYPSSDVLVFHTPRQNPSQEDTLIVTRAVAREEIDGIAYFRTKSDGTGTHKWPQVPDVNECEFWSDYRENYTRSGMISEKLLVGKVVFRIPWVGHLLFFVFSYSWALVVVAIVALLIVVKFVVPRFEGRKLETESEKSSEKSF